MPPSKPQTNNGTAIKPARKSTGPVTEGSQAQSALRASTSSSSASRPSQPRDDQASTPPAAASQPTTNGSHAHAAATESRVESVRRRTGVGYVGIAVSEQDLEQEDESDQRAIVWFDIDNTLYHKSTRIANLMGERIHAYFLGLGLPEEEAYALHQKYYSEHGLAIRGLLKHHKGIDPLDYDRRVDGSLPLDNLLKPEAELIALIRDIDRTKCRVYALTNAYKTHALRCIRLLGLEDLFDGVLYCDYSAGALFCCKPDPGYYEAAAEIVNMHDTSNFYFVDDSDKNIRAAKQMGWRSAVWYKEPEPDTPPEEQRPRDQAETNAVAHFNTSLTLTRDGSFDEVAIREQIQRLSKPMRLKLITLVLDSALPSDIFAISQVLERHLKSTRDVVSHIPDHISTKIFEKLPIRDLLRCRLVSKKWLGIAAQPELWRSHALALTESDPDPVVPQDPKEWETLVKGLYFRERNWELGLAQSIQFCEGHAGFVTAMKLRGRNTLVTGSYDGTIRVWDLGSLSGAVVCKRIIKADKIACLDFLLEENVVAAGLYDTGRILVFDLKTGALLQTLSGHNKGIRNVALNEHYLVSVGQDKAICVWNYRSGERVVRFGQQSNVSLGVCLVDTDKLVAVTIDGVIRSFSIRAKKMIGEFQLSKLGRLDARWSSVMREFSGESGMLSWFAAHRNTITVASKTLIAHLEWREHIVPTRRRRDSTESNVSSYSTVTSPSTSSFPARRRTDSMTSNASTSTASTRTTPMKPAPSASASAGMAASRSPTAPRLMTPSQSQSQSNRSVGLGRSPSAASPSTPSRSVSMKAALSQLSSSTSGAFTPLTGSNLDGESSADGASTRIAPNLTAAPRIISVLRTPEVATGAVHPQKRRVVCSSRFSSRVGAERALYTSTYSDASLSSPRREDSTSTSASGNSLADLSASVGASVGDESFDDAQPLGSSAAASSDAGAGPSFVPIRGAWEAHAADLSAPERNPMSIVLDHESFVIGCSDGLVYRVGFVGSAFSPPKSPAPSGTEGQDVGDATIDRLPLLRDLDGWRDLFLPPGAAEDHPGRVKRDVVKKMGLR